MRGVLTSDTCIMREADDWRTMIRENMNSDACVNVRHTIISDSMTEGAIDTR